MPQIISSDPDYFFWAIDTKVFQGQLAFQSLELHLKATLIRIPQSANGEWHAKLKPLELKGLLPSIPEPIRADFEGLFPPGKSANLFQVPRPAASSRQ